MIKNRSTKHDVREHYADLQRYYVEQYDPALLHSFHEYPANYFRLEIIKRRMRDEKLTRFLDAGVGSGVPAVKLAEHLESDQVWAFDFTPEMVEYAKLLFAESGLEPKNVFLGDVSREEPFAAAVSDAGSHFDAVLMLGVIPHVEDDVGVLRNAKKSLGSGGRAFVSFRNKLFSLFTMNRHTHDLVINELLADVPELVQSAADAQLQGQMAMDKPPVRSTNPEGGVGYDLVLSRMHNPLEMEALFHEAGFSTIKLHWYHYHPCMPYLEGEAVPSQLFRRAAIALEGEDSGWRGYFLCSAFVVEAVV